MTFSGQTDFTSGGLCSHKIRIIICHSRSTLQAECSWMWKGRTGPCIRNLTLHLKRPHRAVTVSVSKDESVNAHPGSSRIHSLSIMIRLEQAKCHPHKHLSVRVEDELDSHGKWNHSPWQTHLWGQWNVGWFPLTRLICQESDEKALYFCYTTIFTTFLPGTTPQNDYTFTMHHYNGSSLVPPLDGCSAHLKHILLLFIDKGLKWTILSCSASALTIILIGCRLWL